MRPRALILTILILEFGVPASGTAQTPGTAASPSGASSQSSADTIKKAQTLFADGNAAYNADKKVEALALLQQSQALVPRASTLHNVANCEQELGRIADALKHFTDVARQLAKNDPALPDVISRIADLEARVPRLRLTLANGVPVTSELKLDGDVLTSDALRSEIRLDPGEHTITVDVSGRPQRSYKIKLAERDRFKQLIETAPEPPVRPLDETKDDHAGDKSSGMRGRRIAGIVLGGIGALGLGLGGVTGILAIDKKNQVDDICPPVPAKCAPDGVAVEDRARVLATTSTIAFIAGGVMATAGVTLVALSGDKGPRKSTALLKASVAPNSVGLAAMGIF